jgi:hypothetical protein
MQPLCNYQATLDRVGYHVGGAVVILLTTCAVTSLSYSDPALGFHLEPRQGTDREQHHRDT